MIHHVNSNRPISYYFPPFKFLLCYIACNSWCMCRRKMYFIKDMHGKVQGFWFMGIYSFPISALKRPSGYAFSFHFFVKGWFHHLWQWYSDALSFSKVFLIFLLLVKISAGFQNKITNYKTSNINNREEIFLDWPWFSYLFYTIVRQIFP